MKGLPQWSLSARLAALFVVLAVLGFSVSGLALYRYLGRTLAHERQHALHAKLEVVGQMVERLRASGQPLGTQWAALSEDLATLHASDLTTHYWVFCGPAAAGRSPCSAPNATLQAAGSTGEWETVSFAQAGIPAVGERSGATLRLLGLHLPAKAGTADEEVLVVVAGDQALLRWTLHRFAALIAGVTVLGGLLTSVLGWGLARWGLQPLADLARQAAELGPERLAQRLPVPVQAPELALLAQSFNGALDRLEASYRQLESFNADVAHELRSPLAVLIGEAEVVLSRQRGSAELQDVLGHQLEALQRLAAMVGDMLFLARADHGERAADLVPLSLRALALDTLEFFESLARERGLTLTVEGDGTVRGNAALLRRALSNLVANAIQYGDAAHPIRVEISANGEACTLWVSNAGAPLPEATRQRMFDRFYRADAARSQHASHHGLGLSIVRAVALMHGGSVFADSAAGRVRVGLRLPGGGPSMQG